MKTLISSLASLAAAIAEPPSADRDLAVAIEARRRTSPTGCRAGPTGGRSAGSARATGSTSAADPEPGTPSSARPPRAPPYATADAKWTASAGAGSRMTTPACGAGPRAGSSWRAVRRSRPRPAPSTLARPGGAKGFEAASIPWRLGSARTQGRAGRPELRRRRAPPGVGSRPPVEAARRRGEAVPRRDRLLRRATPQDPRADATAAAMEIQPSTNAAVTLPAFQGRSSRRVGTRAMPVSARHRRRRRAGRPQNIMQSAPGGRGAAPSGRVGA